MPETPLRIYGAGRTYRKTIADFRGVDLSSAPANVAEYRSPSAPNMMPDLSGKPVKRTGWHTAAVFPARINGIFTLGSGAGARTFVHAGTKLYLGDAGHEVGSGLADAPSFARELCGRLWIADGARLSFCGRTADGAGWELRAASGEAYLPTVTISRDPDGGGTPYEPFNLLGSGFREDFLGKAYATEYQLSYSGLDSDAVTAEVMAAGSTAGHEVWNTLSEGTELSVNRTTGKVTFVAAPGASPVEGEDNVRITARKTVPEYSARINGCDTGALFGVSGAEDRLFLTGCPDMPQSDWYCQLSDPTYWGETWYSSLGGSERIVGYSRFGGRLAAHLAGGGAVIRGGSVLNGEAVFPIENSLGGPAPVSRFGFGDLGGEPLFLTQRGVYALTAQDVTGDKYVQSRSFFIDSALEKEELSAAVCAAWRSFFIVFCGGRAYLLDGAQKTYASGAPYSTHQYECYYWENVPARAAANINGVLTFGTADGRLCEFYGDGSLCSSYTDDGAAITAWWDLPDFSGRRFYENKSLCYAAVKLAAAPRTSVSVLAFVRGAWKALWSEAALFRYLSWSEVSWPYFTWNADPGAKFCGKKRLCARLPSAVLRFRNDAAGEPFGVYEVGLEFSEHGRSRC